MTISSFKFEGQSGVSTLEIIMHGRSYCRFFEKAYTARGLVTKAKRFAEEVASGKVFDER